jgi:glutamyl-tRNA reductase
MSILALGVSYRRARVELLERLSFTEPDYPKAYRHLLDLDPVSEAVLLSTCNRTEVYAEVSSYHAGFLALKRFLSESREVPPEEFADPLYAHYEDDAAEHLFGVAAGIDSMVLGEPQILAQVRQAARTADAEGAAGPIMSAVFRAAVRTGRRARAETAIGASPAVLVDAGMRLAAERIGPLRGCSAAVVGAGGMAGLAAAALRSVGAGRIRILNRSMDHAQRLAERHGGEAHALAALEDALAVADLVVCSTGAAGTVIGVEAAGSALAARSPADRPLFLLDLAVPRDVDPEVAALPGVFVADIDDLKEALAGRGVAPASAGEVAHVEAIVEEEVRRFAAWRRSTRLAPLILALRERGERVQAAELSRVRSRLAGLSEREWEAVEALARGIVAKLLHDPIVRVKEGSGPVAGDGLARALAELFGIEFRPGA